MLRPLLASILAVSLCSTASSQLKRSAAPYGSSCGPTLTATVQAKGNTHYVSLSFKGAKSDSKLVMMVAAEKTGLPLSWFFTKTDPTCRLLLVPIFVQQHNPDSSGNYTYGHSLPAEWRGTAYAQFLEFQADGTVLATNGVSVTSTSG